VRQTHSITADLPFYFEPCAVEPCYPWHSEDLDLLPELSGTIVPPCRISSSGDTALLSNTFSVHNFHISNNQLILLRYLNIIKIKWNKNILS
jgi:hypothetical protein